MDVAPFVDDLVHEPTQTEGRGVDLTVAGVLGLGRFVDEVVDERSDVHTARSRPSTKKSAERVRDSYGVL